MDNISLKISEAGKIIGLSKPVLMRLIKIGEIKGYKIGTNWHIDSIDLDNYRLKCKQDTKKQ